MEHPRINLSLCAIPLFFCACHATRFDEQIKEMTSRSVQIQSNKMCLISKNDSTYKFNSKSPFTMIYYIDSTHCTSCTLNAADEWIRELQPLSKDGELNTMIIVQPKKKEQRFMATLYSDSELTQPIWMDTCGIFMTNNPHIPDNSLFHNFMIDSLYNIVLIGNPAINNKLMQLATDITKKEIETKQ